MYIFLLSSENKKNKADEQEKLRGRSVFERLYGDRWKASAIDETSGWPKCTDVQRVCYFFAFGLFWVYFGPQKGIGPSGD